MTKVMKLRIRRFSSLILKRPMALLYSLLIIGLCIDVLSNMRDYSGLDFFRSAALILILLWGIRWDHKKYLQS